MADYGDADRGCSIGGEKNERMRINQYLSREKPGRPTRLGHQDRWNNKKYIRSPLKELYGLGVSLLKGYGRWRSFRSCVLF